MTVVIVRMLISMGEEGVMALTMVMVMTPQMSEDGTTAEWRISGVSAWEGAEAGRGHMMAGTAQTDIVTPTSELAERLDYMPQFQWARFSQDQSLQKFCISQMRGVTTGLLANVYLMVSIKDQPLRPKVDSVGTRSVHLKRLLKRSLL